MYSLEDGPLFRKPKSTSLVWITSATKLATYDILTKEFNVIGATREVMFDIAMSPEGILYGVDSTGNKLYTIDRKTAEIKLVGTMNPEGFINSLTFGQYGALYGCQGTNLVKINPKTAAVTIIGDMGYSSAGDMVFINNNLYMSSTTNELILVNISNPGSSSSIKSIPVTYGLATVFISEGICGGSYHLYGTSGAYKTIYEINPHNGNITNADTLPSFGDGEDTVTNGATSSQFTWI